MSEILVNQNTYAPLTQDQRDAAVADMVRKSVQYRLASEVDPVFSILWSELTAQEQADWEAYRLLLLGITEQPEFPHRISWPTRPGQGTDEDWLAKLHADRYPYPEEIV
jgi:hypothetical protein